MSKKESITPQTAKHLFTLARIDATESYEVLAKQLREIIEFFDLLEESKTRVEPTIHNAKLNNALREDLTEESDSEEVMKNAVSLKGKYVKAPKMG